MTLRKQTVRVVATRRGARLVQHGTVLSEVLAEPGPTHSVFDVLAAILHVLSPGPRVALLGFAAGSLVAPLRRLGSDCEVDAVDLDDGGFAVFQRFAGAWAGKVRFTKADACQWLEETIGCYDVILDDLSIGHQGDVIKPEVSWDALPVLMKRKLRPGGLAISNLLRPAGCSWDAGLRQAARFHPAALVVELEEYENRILIAGEFSISAGELSRRLRAALRTLGSRQASRLRVATHRLKEPARRNPAFR